MTSMVFRINRRKKVLFSLYKSIPALSSRDPRCKNVTKGPVENACMFPGVFRASFTRGIRLTNY